MTQPKPLVAIDANILVWGLRRQGPAEKIQRAGWLFDQFDRDQAQVVVSSIAVSEYLIPAAATDHRNIVAAISSRFIIAPFDAHCAAMAAELFPDGKITRNLGKPHGEQGARDCLKSDCYIIASARAAGATLFYSNDEECRDLAKRVMEVSDLPGMPPHLWGFKVSASDGSTAPSPPSLRLPTAERRIGISTEPSPPSTLPAAKAQLPPGSSPAR